MSKEEIINYLMYTPRNPNRKVLEGMLGDGDWGKLYDYVFTTSYNMNRKVLETFFSDNDSAAAVVGTAIVGQTVL